MQTVPIYQAKDRFSALLQAVEDGEEIVITRHGKKIARIVKETEESSTDLDKERLRQKAIAEIEAFHAMVKPDAGYKKGDWKKYRDEGRKY
jgi:prevent-host-death family protein